MSLLPLTNLFTPKVKQELNTSVDSDITIPGVGTISILSSTGGSPVLIKNSVPVGASTATILGDQIQVRLTSPNAYNESFHVILDFNSETHVFTCTAKADPTSYNVPQFLELYPNELTQYRDGSEYIPNHNNNKLNVYNKDTLALSSSRYLTSGVISQPLDSDTIAITSYHTNKVLFIKPNLTIQAVVELTGKPWGLAAVPVNRDSDLTSTLWVTLTDQNKVVVIDQDLNIIDEHSVGTSPLGIAISADYNNIWVCNSGSDNVTHFKWNGVDYDITTVPVGDKPFEVTTDTLGNAWLTCKSALYRITTADSVTNYSIGDNPRGIALYSGSIAVCLSSANQVVFISTATLTLGNITNTVNIPGFPYFLNTNGIELYIACLGSKEIAKIESYAETTRIVTQPFPYSVIVEDNNLYIPSMWANQPEYTYKKLQTVQAFYLNEVVNAELNTQIISNTVEALGIDEAVPCSVPDIYDAVIYKNSVNVGTSTTVIDGDEIYVESTTPVVEGKNYQIPVFMGNVYDWFRAETKEIDILLQPFYLGVTNAVPGEEVLSLEVTVAELEPLSSINLNISEGVIVKNNVDTGLTTATITNGDTFRIKYVAGLVNSNIIVDAGVYRNIWTINVIVDNYVVPYNESGKSLIDIVQDYPASFGSVEKFSIAGTLGSAIYTQESIYDLTDAPHLLGCTVTQYVVDVYNEQVLKLELDDLSNSGVDQVWSLPNKPFDICYVPYSATPGDIGTKRFVTIPDLNRLYDFENDEITVLPFTPYGACTGTDNKIYVASSNGILVVEENLGVYSYTTSYLTGHKLVGIFADADGIYATCLTHNKLYHLNYAGVLIQEYTTEFLPYSVCATDDYIYTANFGDSSISKATKGMPAVTHLTLPRYCPTDIIYHTTSQNLIVSCFYGNVNLAITEDLQNIIEIGTNTECYKMTEVSGNLIAHDLSPGLIAAGNVAEFNGINSLSFTTISNATISTEYTSSLAVIPLIPRPITIYVQPYTDAVLVKNNIEVGQSDIFETGDDLEIRGLSSEFHGVNKLFYITHGSNESSFLITTEPDLIPDLMVYDSQYNIPLRSLLDTNALPIAGLSSGFSTNIEVYSNIPNSVLEAKLVVNDIELSDSELVENGDNVKIRFIVKGITWNGDLLTVYLRAQGQNFAIVEVESAYLNGPDWDPHPADKPYSQGTPIPLKAQSVDIENSYGVEITKSLIIPTEIDFTALPYSINKTEIDALFEYSNINNTYSLSEVQQYSAVSFSPYKSDMVYITDGTLQGRTVSLVDASSYLVWASKLNVIDFENSYQIARFSVTTSQVIPYENVTSSSLHETPSTYENMVVYHISLVEPSYSLQEINKTMEFDVSQERIEHSLNKEKSVTYEYNSYRLIPFDMGFEKVFVKGLYEYTLPFAVFENVETIYINSEYSMQNKTTTYTNIIPIDKQNIFNYAEYPIDALLKARTTFEFLQNEFSITKIKYIEINVTEYIRKAITYLEFPVNVERNIKNWMSVNLPGFGVANAEVFYSMAYTAPDIRAYTTAQDAIDAGILAGYPNAEAYQLSDGNWFWYVDATIQSADCATEVAEGRLRPVSWYVQGG